MCYDIVLISSDIVVICYNQCTTNEIYRSGIKMIQDFLNRTSFTNQTIDRSNSPFTWLCHLNHLFVDFVNFKCQICIVIVIT